MLWLQCQVEGDIFQPEIFFPHPSLRQNVSELGKQPPEYASVALTITQAGALDP